LTVDRLLARPWFKAAVATTFVASVALVYYFTASYIFDADCYVYSVVARTVLDGGKLYIDVWDNKPPLTYSFYMVSEWLRPGSLPVLQTLLGVWLAVGALVFVRLAEPSTRTASWLTALFLAFFPASANHSVWASTENITNTFALMLLAIGLRVRKRGASTTLESLGVGALMTLSFHVRQNTVLFGLVPLYELVTRGTREARWRALGHCIGGAMVAAIPIISFVALRSSLHEYLRVTFLDPRRFVAASGPWESAHLLWWFLGTELSVVLCLFGPWAIHKGPRSLILGALAVSVVVCVSPNKPYHDYMVSLVPAAGLVMLVALDGEDLRQPQTPGILLAVFLLTAPNVARTARGWLSEDPTAPYDAIARYVDAQARPGDRLLVMGHYAFAPYVYYAAHVRPAHRIFADEYYEGHLARLIPEPLEAVFADYGANPPTILVVWPNELRAPREGSSNRARLFETLLGSGAYSLIQSFGDAEVYRRHS
jgi:hypothetical protein